MKKEIAEKITKLEDLRDILGDETVNEKIAELQTAGGAVIAGNVNTQGGDFVGHDKINISLTEKYWRTHHLSPTDDEKIAAEKYLRYLFDRHRYLNFRGMGVSDRIPLKLPLLDIYVPLKARRELPEGETWARVQLGGEI